MSVQLTPALGYRLRYRVTKNPSLLSTAFSTSSALADLISWTNWTFLTDAWGEPRHRNVLLPSVRLSSLLSEVVAGVMEDRD